MSLSLKAEHGFAGEHVQCRFECSGFRVQRRRRLKERPVKSKKKLMKFNMKKRISNIES
jgi:hypothetical protein